MLARITAYFLRVVVDEGSALQVGVDQVVHGVLLGQLAVRCDQDSFQDDVGVAEVGDNFVDTVIRGTENRKSAKSHQSTYGRERISSARPPAPHPPPQYPLCQSTANIRGFAVKLHREHVHTPLFRAGRTSTSHGVV